MIAAVRLSARLTHHEATSVVSSVIESAFARWASAFALLFSTLAGCAESPHQDQGARPWASDESWIDVELAASSSADALLAIVLGLEFGHGDAVYVNDPRQPGVLALDSLLRLRAIFGGFGEGPGEFVVKANIQALPEDSLLVFDPDIKRATVFAADVPDSSRMTGAPAHVENLWCLAGRARRHLAVSTPAFHADGDARADAIHHDVFSILDASGEATALDSAFAAPSAEQLVVRSPGRVSVSDHSYGREGFVRVLPGGGFAYMNSGALSVTVFDAEATDSASFFYPTRPIPVSSEHFDSVVANRSPAAARMLRDEAPYTWPPVVGMAVDDRDRIWIGLRGQSGETLWEWAAFTRRGRHVASVRLPSNFRVLDATGEKLLGFATDDLDVPQIHVYRLLWEQDEG